MGGEEKELISYAGSGLQTYLTSENFAGGLNLLERTQAKHEEMNFHFSRPHADLSVLLLDEIDLMILMSYSSLMKYMSS